MRPISRASCTPRKRPINFKVPPSDPRKHVKDAGDARSSVEQRAGLVHCTRMNAWRINLSSRSSTLNSARVRERDARELPKSGRTWDGCCGRDRALR